MAHAASFEHRAEQLGLQIPDFAADGYYGADVYGSMKPHHIGDTLTTEEGYQAARLTALNCLGGIRLALGSLDRVKGIVRSLCFVVCTPEYTDVHKVSSGATDLFADVFGPEAGLGGRATIGVMSLAGGSSFENWVTVEIA